VICQRTGTDKIKRNNTFCPVSVENIITSKKPTKKIPVNTRSRFSTKKAEMDCKKRVIRGNSMSGNCVAISKILGNTKANNEIIAHIAITISITGYVSADLYLFCIVCINWYSFDNDCTTTPRFHECSHDLIIVTSHSSKYSGCLNKANDKDFHDLIYSYICLVISLRAKLSVF